MKKISTLLTSAFCLLAVVACAEPETSASHYDSEDSLTSSASVSQKYHLTVNASILPISPDFPKGGDYEAGHTFNFKVKIFSDYAYVPYLNDDPLDPISSEGEYNNFSFVMPDKDSLLEISEDRFHQNRPYTLAEIYSWVNESTLTSVKVEYGNAGVDPETHKPTIKYSEKAEDITYNLDVLTKEKLVRVSANEALADGGWYRTITYGFANGRHYEINISNGSLIASLTSRHSYFKFESENPRYPDIITNE